MSKEHLIPPPPDYKHFTENYWQRGLQRKLDITGEDFDAALRDYGHSVIWERAAPCPNLILERGDSKRHDFNCPLCKNRRWIYWQTLGDREEEFQVTIQSVDPQQSFFMEGRFISGTARITFPAGHIPFYWDRVTVKNEIIIYSEAIPIRELSKSLVLRYEPLRILKGVCAVNREDWDLPTLPLGDQDEEVVRRDLTEEDFRIIEGTREVEIIGFVPPTQYVTLVYYTHPEFVIIEIENISRFHSNVEEKLGWPITAIGRLDFFIEGDEQKEEPPTFDRGERLIEE